MDLSLITIPETQNVDIIVSVFLAILSGLLLRISLQIIGQKLENLQLAVQKTADKKRQVEVIGKEKGGGSGKGQADDCPPKKRRSRVA